MTKHIVISDEARKKLEKIKLLRPQDSSMAQTIDHLIYSYEEQNFKPEKGIVHTRHVRQIIASNVSSPIIDADKLQNVSKIVRDNK